jgi:MFS family permease
VLAVATIGLALGFSNVGVVAFGLFIIPLSEQFGWGRGEISIAVLVMNYTLVLAAPCVGFLTDRLGVRKVLLPSIVLFAFGIGALAYLDDNIVHFYLMYLLITILGIGTIPASYTKVVVAWFDRRRGLAVGIAMAGVGLGAVVIPPYVQYLIGAFGWQAGYLGLAVLVLAVCLPTVYLFLVERPGDVGQFPDGATSEAHADQQRAQGFVGFTFRLCLRKRAFWLMMPSFVLLGFATSGVLHHLVPLLRDRGVSADLAALGASVLGLALIFGRIVCGLLLDRYFAPRVVVVFLIFPAVGLAMLSGGVTGAWAFTALVLVGLGVGAELDFMSYLTSRYLGQVAYGSAYGWLYAAFAIGAGVGPVVMGYTYEIRGDYDAALSMLCAATVLAILPFARLGPYPSLPVHLDGLGRPSDR